MGGAGDGEVAETLEKLAMLAMGMPTPVEEEGPAAAQGEARRHTLATKTLPQHPRRNSWHTS